MYTEKDLGLGVMFEENLTFDEHISNKVRIANGIMGRIRNGFSYFDGKTFKRLYTALV